MLVDCSVYWYNVAVTIMSRSSENNQFLKEGNLVFKYDLTRNLKYMYFLEH